jgi:hypothetical protein
LVSEEHIPADEPQPDELDLDENLDELDPPDDPVEDDLPAEDDPPPRQPASARDTIKSLRSRAQSAERANAEYERRLAAVESRQQQPAPTFDPQAAAREEAQFRSSLEQMMPHEAALAVAERSERKMQAQLFQARIEGFDRSDAAVFDQLRASNKAADRLAPEVERLLSQRRQGGDFSLGRRDIPGLLGRAGSVEEGAGCGGPPARSGGRSGGGAAHQPRRGPGRRTARRQGPVAGGC